MSSILNNPEFLFQIEQSKLAAKQQLTAQVNHLTQDLYGRVDGIVEQIYDQAMVDLERALIATSGATQQVSPPSDSIAPVAEAILRTSQKPLTTPGSFQMLSQEDFRHVPDEESLDELFDSLEIPANFEQPIQDLDLFNAFDDLVQTDASLEPVDVRPSNIYENPDDSHVEVRWSSQEFIFPVPKNSETLQIIEEEQEVFETPEEPKRRQPSNDSLIMISSKESSSDKDDDDFVAYCQMQQF